MTAVEIFVDETKRSDYVLCAAVVSAHDLTAARKIMRELKPHNRNRLHMHDEGAANRRRIIADFVRRTPIREAHIWVATIGGRSERSVREDCLRELAIGVTALGARRILVESCSQDKQDRAVLTDALAGIGALDKVRVDIDVPAAHELLWAADLVAWAYAAGGRERRQIEPFVTVHRI